MIGTTNSSIIARSSLSSRPGYISSEVSTRTTQRARRCTTRRVFGAKGIDKRRGQRRDHFGLTGQLAAEWRASDGKPRCQRGTVAHHSQRRGDARDQPFARILDAIDLLLMARPSRCVSRCT